jgi:hypothetical protein
MERLSWCSPRLSLRGRVLADFGYDVGYTENLAGADMPCRYRRGRDSGSKKRARCGISAPDVGDGQDAGRQRALGPAAEG